MDLSAGSAGNKSTMSILASGRTSHSPGDRSPQCCCDSPRVHTRLRRATLSCAPVTVTVVPAHIARSAITRTRTRLVLRVQRTRRMLRRLSGLRKTASKTLGGAGGSGSADDFDVSGFGDVGKPLPTVPPRSNPHASPLSMDAAASGGASPSTAAAATAATDDVPPVAPRKPLSKRPSSLRAFRTEAMKAFSKDFDQLDNIVSELERALLAHDREVPLDQDEMVKEYVAACERQRAVLISMIELVTSADPDPSALAPLLDLNDRSQLVLQKFYGFVAMGMGAGAPTATRASNANANTNTNTNNPFDDEALVSEALWKLRTGADNASGGQHQQTTTTTTRAYRTKTHSFDEAEDDDDVL